MLDYTQGTYQGERNASNQPQGKGSCSWPDGSTYEGYWANGKMHGVGTLNANGRKTKGFWFDGELIHTFEEQQTATESYSGETNSAGQPHGKGTKTFSDGSRYEGYWADGKMHGVGTLYAADGRLTRGFWFTGELIHTFSEEPAPAKLPKNKNKIAALLIGNNYPGTDNQLTNCIADVEAIGQKLRNIGIDVTILKNASQSEMIDAFEELSKKDSKYEHALFYFSGHGDICGPFHRWDTNDEMRIWKELHFILPFVKTSFKNIVIISDACNITRPITQDELEDKDIKKIIEAQNAFHNRQLISAYSSLNGQASYDIKNQTNGIYALALMEYIEQPNIRLMDMFSKVNNFVIEYSKKRYGGLLQIPHTDFTRYDPDFCLYSPEDND